MRNKFIAGNWKMNTIRSETVSLIHSLVEKTQNIKKTSMLVAPPFTNLETAAGALRNSKIHLGAQNLYWEERGAYTGEISPLMLKDLGCTHVIIGHSERRQYFKETDVDVNRKVAAAIKQELLPIVCVGETLEQREMNQTLSVVEHQIRHGLQGFLAADAAQFTIAYEPVWAIGTGKAAKPADAVEVHSWIRVTLAELFGKVAADSIRIQYGGSVTSENAAAFLCEPEIDGALVGGASLKADTFAAIIRAAEEA
jgi:triosephosphate isomerase